MQAETQAKLAEMRKERDTLKTLNESLLKNTENFKTRTQTAESEATEAKLKVSELEDQVGYLCGETCTATPLLRKPKRLCLYDMKYAVLI